MVGTAFVYDAFSKTVLQCFCRTCQVSIAEKKLSNPPATSTVVRRPPKKVEFLAAEVRCTEKSKGGLKYELVLSKPALDEPPKLASPPRSSLSVEEIQNKLKAAEERRLSLEAKRLTQITEQLDHLNEVKEKREEYNNNFIKSTREYLELKMESSKENRETFLKLVQEKVRDHVLKVEEIKRLGDTPPRNEHVLEAIKKKLDAAAMCREEHLACLQERLREHENHIMEVRKQMDTHTENLRERLDKKLELAQEKREALFKEIQERSKEHDKHIADVKRQLEEQTEMLREKHTKKLEIAKEKREAMIKEIQDKIMEHRSHILQVKQINLLNQQVTDVKLQEISKKLDAAESKRLTQLQAKQEKLLQHDRHAEEVRRKAGSMSNNENSSG